MYTAMQEDGPHQKPGEVFWWGEGGQRMGALACRQVSCSLASLKEKWGEEWQLKWPSVSKSCGLKVKGEGSLVFLTGSLHRWFYFAKCTGIKMLIRIRVSV